MSRRPASPAFRLRAVFAAAIATALSAPFFSIGCAGDKSCIQWNSVRGPCPTRAEALNIMLAACGPVLSVDSDGELEEDNTFCCYDVTKADDDFGIPCGIGPGIPVPPPSVGPGPMSSVVTAVTSGSGFFPGCEGLIGGECGSCMETLCCTELLNCYNDTSCLNCLNDKAACLDDPGAGLQADTFDACVRNSCSDICFGESGPAPDCSASPPGVSGGACITPDDKTILCNPVTNEPCSDGSTCDLTTDGFKCQKYPFEQSACSSCGATGWCAPGFTCLNGFCARFCCDDSDCDFGYCDANLPAALDAPIGLCVQEQSGAGGSGAGGSGQGGAGQGGQGGAGQGGG